MLVDIGGNLTRQSQACSEDDFLNYYAMFKFSIRSEITRKYYERRVKQFLNYIRFELEDGDIENRSNMFAFKANHELKWAVECIVGFLQYQKNRVENGEITAATLRNYVKAIKSFSDACDMTIPWKRITRGLPRGRQASNDRAPTIDEIQKILEYPDRRIGPIIFTMLSSGIRLGAWDLLRWKNVEPITDKNGDIKAAKLVVYGGDVEEYYSFITPEAYESLKRWMDFRKSYGEKITDNSWLMRDLWQTTNTNYGARWGLATNPRRLKSSGVKRLLERAIWEQGIRQPLKEGAKRHDWKAAHGMRKLYKTRAEQVMKPINVEITMGHDIGLSASYYKPTIQEVLGDYLKAVPLLTVHAENLILQKQINELTEKTNNNDYLVNAKLREEDDALTVLSDQVIKLMDDVRELKRRQ
ncbi:MAG TPA: hypothetical protein VH500_14190 [Nitrososphaeraceae archaeon]|jgi:hypothetical protein